MILLPRAWFQSLVGELRSHKPCSTAKKKKNFDLRQLDSALYERISLLSDMIKLPYRPSNCKITTYILIAWSLLSGYIKALKLFFMKLKLKNEIYLLIEMCLFFFFAGPTLRFHFQLKWDNFWHWLNMQSLSTHLREVKHFSKMIIVFPWMKSERKATQSCLTLCDPMDYTVHGILQAMEWVAFPFSRGSYQPRNRTRASWIAGRFFI